MRNGADLDSLDGKQQQQRFNCWHCGSELVWGGDHDLDDYTQDYDIVSNFQCMNCETFVEVYHKCQ
ncbi:MAG: hypothetical protein CBC73_05225 [Flavobacteriales bacterium TMED113]|jgi:transcription elongation factor Elf1|nr:MAG: hypothetical protein CBC73_05225 [Flavobacteriales bacterium TMED113]|tara:strand:- start:343 stop:540 length:198 start_codon:yes stop_codon:yes gene_type:complete